MRRITTADILKRNIHFIIVGATFLLIGLELPLLPVMVPSATYEELQPKEIVIESVEWIHQHKGADFYRITTESGEHYNITGEYERSRVEELLSSGTRASIRYYEGKFLFSTRKYAEVIYVDRECVSAYDNDEDNGTWVLYLLGALSVLLGLGILYIVIWEVRRFRKYQEMRNKRIAKKYPSGKKK